MRGCHLLNRNNSIKFVLAIAADEAVSLGPVMVSGPISVKKYHTETLQVVSCLKRTGGGVGGGEGRGGSIKAQKIKTARS